jgi:hypothetical protein
MENNTYTTGRRKIHPKRKNLGSQQEGEYMHNRKEKKISIHIGKEKTFTGAAEM